MDYQQSVAMAPAGWTHFRLGDLERLPPAVKAREMARVPASEREQLANGDSDAIRRIENGLCGVSFRPDRRKTHAPVGRRIVPHQRQRRRGVDLGQA